MAFQCQGGDLKNTFITEADVLDRFVGNQLWTWGNNAHGELGNNATAHQSSPVQTIAGGTNWAILSQTTSSAGAVGAIKTDGTLWSWGIAENIGNNLSVNQSSPVQTISGRTTWKQISVASAIKTDGTLWLWGSSFFGGLGNNSITTRSSPVQTIAGGTNWKQISRSNWGNTSAIKTDGTLWTWGYNTYGGLGNNATAHQSSPVQTIAGGTNWKSVSTGRGNVGAIKCDGTLWMWGGNNCGQLGINSITNRSSPTQTISGGTNWKQININNQSGGIKTDGTLWLWGSNSFGVLGTNDTIYTYAASSPVQTIAGGTNWKSVSVGVTTTAGIKTDGTLWTWGYNSYGTLGNNNNISQSSPVQTIAGGTNWKCVTHIKDTTIAAITFNS